MTTLPRLANFEYRSKEKIGSWPLIHINIGANPETGQPLVAKGVIAIGNIAFGVVSIGVVAFGLVTLAVLGVGLVSLASFAIGIIAIGAVALGYEFALGAAVQSANIALGVTTIDIPIVLASLILAVATATVILRWRKGKAGRLPG